MIFIKKLMLCSFLITTNCYLLCNIDNSLPEEDQDLLLICDNDIEKFLPIDHEEIFPLEEIDSVCLACSVNDLEIDPISIDDAVTENLQQNIEIISPALDILHVDELSSLDNPIICYLDDNHTSCNLLDGNKKLDDNNDQETIILTTMDLPEHNCCTVSVHTTEPAQIINIVSTDQAEKSNFINDDDIIPVPHELINSVKKAAKKKKKLEEKQKKEKYKRSKKSKK